MAEEGEDREDREGVGCEETIDTGSATGTSSNSSESICMLSLGAKLESIVERERQRFRFEVRLK